MSVQPLNERVLVRPEKTAEKKVGGIFIPDTNMEGPNEGVVVEVAPEGVKNVRKGDRVIFKKDSGEEISVNGEKLLIVESQDLIAKINETDAIPA